MIRLLRPIALACALCASVAHAETRFLSAFQDLPLAPGLEEQAVGGFAFAADQGRIEEAGAAGRVGEGTVRDYYRAALPALGWSLDRDDAAGLGFARGRERLTLAFQRGSDGLLVVRYRVVARTASLALD